MGTSEISPIDYISELETLDYISIKVKALKSKKLNLHKFVLKMGLTSEKTAVAAQLYWNTIAKENATFILRGDDNCALQIMKDIITQQKSRNSFYYLFCDIEAEIKIG